MTADERAAVRALLNDVVQSEHCLRHANAFEALCRELGMECVHGPSRSEVTDPQAGKPKPKRARKS